MLKPAPPAPPPPSSATKYLTVRLGRETYGVEVLKVREIIRMQQITAVPHSPAHMRGVINLRGRVVPVIDLRTWFNFNAGFTDRTCIVVACVRLPTDHSAHIGLIVDSVEEVVPLQRSDIAAAPNFGAKLETTHLLGIANIKGTLITLLDIERVVAADPPVVDAA